MLLLIVVLVFLGLGMWLPYFTEKVLRDQFGLPISTDVWPYWACLIATLIILLGYLALKVCFDTGDPLAILATAFFFAVMIPYLTWFVLKRLSAQR